jgi:hypothetical protein
MDREGIYEKLLYILRARVRQLKVRSPGEAEEFFLSRIEDANPIKELLLLQAQREDYRNIESRLREKLDSEMGGER